MIQIKRVYEPVEAHDGPRFLVDRLWPRGIKKEALHMQAWLKEVAPSTALRVWFNHQPEKWDEFNQRYTAELQDNPAAWAPLLAALNQGDITLIYSSRNVQYNHAIVLKAFLEARLKSLP